MINVFSDKNPEIIFHIDERPEFISDLSKIDISSKELAIKGKTKNIERLKLFKDLEKLWIYTINQKEFNIIMDAIDPNMLYIYEMRVADLSALQSLTNLEVLGLEWNTKANELWDLSCNKSLKSLLIKDFPKLNEVTPLQACTGLEYLELSGGIWNSLKLMDLRPLKDLANIQYLCLSNINVQDNSLEPISFLKGLQELHISNQFPTEEFARLSVALPHTKCDQFKPYVFLESPIDDKDVMVTGKRKPFLHSKRDEKRLQKYEEQFKAFQSQYQ